MYLKSVVCSLVLLALSAPAYSATVQTYNSRSTFEAALIGSPALIDFNDLLGYTEFNTSRPYAGIQFSQIGAPSGSYEFYSQLQGGSAWFDWGTGTVLVLPSATGSYVDLVLPSAMTAFGFHAMTIFPYGGSMKVILPELGATEYAVTTANYPTPTWAGFTSDTSFTTVRIVHFDGRGIIDNLEYGTATQQQDPPGETPEIATLLMIGTGLVALRFGGRRLRTFAT